MVTHEPPPMAARRTPSGLGWALVLVVVTLLGVVAHRSLAVEDPGEGGLDPSLLDAFRLASTDAAGQDIELVVNSGWRSPDEQERLLAEAVARYGSRDEAARWVATPDTSPHVSGDAIDVGPPEGATWLSAHGAAYGLCQIYGNEPWHFELRPDAVQHGCPAMYADPTHDSRMQE
jgi:LAS superfamily LD-carboxypeptidase LdcB